MVGGWRKRPRISTTPQRSRTITRRKPSSPTFPDETLTAITSRTIPWAPPFTHCSPSDVTLRLHFDPPSPSSHEDLELSLHSEVLRRSNYFSALLSGRWQIKDSDSASTSTQGFRLNLTVSSSRYDSFDDHLKVLHLLYTSDFDQFINNVSTALSIIHVALELLFEECVKACLRFIEAVAWTDEEEQKVLDLIPLLKEGESRELCARVRVEKEGFREEMLHNMITGAMEMNVDAVVHPTIYKLAVENLLREFKAKEFVRVVLFKEFDARLNRFRESFRGHLNVLGGISNVHLCLESETLYFVETMWLVETMIEVGVADYVARKWSSEDSLAEDLVKVLRGNLQFSSSSLCFLVLTCLHMLTNGVASGSILIDRQVRVDLVRNWLPFLIALKEQVFLTPGPRRQLFEDLEQAFLKILSTLPISDSKDFLQQCLAFTTYYLKDCPLLISTLKTWFRRASRPPQDEGFCLSFQL